MEDSILLVRFDLDGELLSGRESTLVGQGEEPDLVQSIRGVGDQLTEEDLTGREKEGRRDRKRERERERERERGNWW